jgi:hypothetical protein
MMWGSSGETPFDVAVSDQHLQLWQVASICDIQDLERSIRAQQYAVRCCFVGRSKWYWSE